MKFTIILPTYNESSNVAPLVSEIHKNLKSYKGDYEILFVDDSNDNTPDEIKKQINKYKNICLLHREKKQRTGLATAFVDGFKLAKGEYILCMDSDLQHPPKTIPALFQTILDTKSDIVVATRYRKGGGADGLNTVYRKLVSHFSRFASWLILPPTRKTTDPGSGFFIFKKSIIEGMSFEGLRGFKILIDILSRVPHAIVNETPFVFAKRENDQSKATVEQGIAFLHHIIALRKYFLRHRQQEKISVKNAKGIMSRLYARHQSGDITMFVIDSVVVAGIIGLGWFLIGYYTHYNYIYTGYEDWIYHAFRVRSIEEYGIPSWNHIWSSGINFWRMYQYVAHAIILLTVKLTGLPITKVLILSLVSIYIGLRVVLYIFLRLLGVSPLFAGMSAVALYTVVQEWGSMQDYSIYVSFAALPLYIMFWIATFKNQRWIYVLTAVTGAIWTFHPVLGFNASILLGFLVLFTPLKNDTVKLVKIGLLYLVSATPFLIQYFTAGYFFTNPLFKSYIYLSLSVLAPYRGLSMTYWILFTLSWVLFVWKSHLLETWSKVLLAFSSFFLALVYLGQHNYLPDFLVQFQFSRGITAIAIILVFVFGSIFQQSFRDASSQIIIYVFGVFIAASAVHAIDIASRYYVAPPVQNIQDPVAIYFADKPLPKGSVFVDNVSQSSYFAPEGIRYATSYNEHMQPQPYSTRLRVLMRNSLGYTGISKSHIADIENYATALGIEYLFLPETSPLVDGLTKKENAYFDEVDVIESDPLPDAITVLHYNRPIFYAFLVDKEKMSQDLLVGDIPKPTLSVATYQPWDVRIAKMANLMRSDAVMPLDVSFIDTDRLRIVSQEGSDMNTNEDSIIIVTQSYDKNWHIENDIHNMMSDSIDATPLRFMRLNPIQKDDTISFDLKNSWPAWHWPMQSVGICTVFLTYIYSIVTNRKLKTVKNK